MGTMLVFLYTAQKVEQAAPNLILGHSRNGAAVDDGDILGDITFVGHDGTDLNSRASIIRSIMTADGTNNSLYADLVFFTKRNSGGYPEESLRITSAGNVGINSTIPRSKLHVASGTSGYNTGNPTGIGAGAIASIESNGNVGLQFLSGNSYNNYIYFGDTNSATTGSIQYSHSANALIFNVNGGTERLRITSGGNVGIGITNPGSLLHVSGADANAAKIKIEDNNNGFAASEINVANGGRDLRIAAPQDIYFEDVDNGEKHLYIESGGNIGIGTEDPDKKLRVEGDARITGTLTIGEASTISTIIDGSVEYPSIRPTLDLNFAATKVLDDRIAFTRDSIGTYVDDMGIVRTASNNTPRFDHDPTTGESLGLLIEESRTNQMIYSSDITGDVSQNSGYGVQNGTVSMEIRQQHLMAQQLLINMCNSTNGIHGVDLLFTSGQITNSTAYTFSVFVKANGYDKLYIRYGGYNADNHGLGYDLSDGTTFAGKFDGTGSLGAVTSSSMIAYPNGWYKCSFTFTTASDAASGAAGMLYYISNSESTTNFAGDGMLMVCISGVLKWKQVLSQPPTSQHQEAQ